MRTSAPITVYGLSLCAPIRMKGRLQMAQLETGSPEMQVTRHAARNMEALRIGKMQGAFQEVETLVVRLPSISWLGKKYDNLSAPVVPDRKERTPFPIEVVLGNTLLLERMLCLDFRMMVARAGVPPGYSPTIRVPMQVLGGVPSLDAKMGGEYVHAIIDTGAGHSVLNAQRMDVHGERILSFSTLDTTGASRNLELFRGPSLAIGGKDLGPLEYSMIDLQDLEGIFHTPIDLILGVNAMLRTGGVWILDAGAGELSWG